MRRALVSIVMPVYNGERYVREAIESLIAQSYGNWELIVVDDGSIDSTETIINSIDDSRVRYIYQQNGGVSSARNRGLDMVRGDYITFLDADDTLPVDSLKERVAHMERNPSVDIVDGKIILKDADMGRDVRVYRPYYKGELLPKLLKLDDRVFFNVCYLFRREQIDNLRFREGMTHAEDLLFYIEMSSRRELKYDHIDGEVYHYRTDNGSAMSNIDGLESGYIRLIDEVSKLNISPLKLLLFRAKIAKIISLSWLSEKRVLRALKSILYIFNIVKKG